MGLLIALLSVLCLGAVALAATTRTATLISTGPDGGNGAEVPSYRGSSEDGSRVFFETAEPLVSADTDSQSDIYERFGETTTLISTAQGGGSDAEDVYYSDSSADGRRVFFEAYEQLVAADTDSESDVYERSGTTTTLISTGLAVGNGPFGSSYGGSSEDGSRVFFETDEPLVVGDTDDKNDLYERSGDTTTLLSIGPDGGNGVWNAEYVASSADGSRVFFKTDEPLVGADADGGNTDVYEHSGGTTTLISIGPQGGGGGMFATYEGSSADGDRVFFTTSEQLVAADTDSQSDIYERSAGATTLLSTGPKGGNGDVHAFYRGSSADGDRVFFTTSEQLVAADTDSQSDIYERSAGATTLLSTGPSGGNGNAVPVYRGSSADGSRVFFQTNEQLVAADTDSQSDVYEHSAGAMTLISAAPGVGDGPFNSSYAGSSADGGRVIFETLEQLLAADTDATSDLYERSARATTLISTGPDGGNGAEPASYRGSSNDGSRVFFATAESLIAGDLDSSQDIYLSKVDPPPDDSPSSSPQPSDSSSPDRQVAAPSNRFTPRPNIRLLGGGTRAVLTVVVPGPGVLRARSKLKGAARRTRRRADSVGYGDAFGPSARLARRWADSVGHGDVFVPSALKKKAGGKRCKRVRGRRKCVRPKRPLLRPAVVRAERAGPIRIIVRLTGTGKSILAKRRVLRIPVVLTFKPTGGRPASRRRVVTFRKPGGKRCKRLKGEAKRKCRRAKRR